MATEKPLHSDPAHWTDTAHDPVRPAARPARPALDSPAYVMGAAGNMAMGRALWRSGIRAKLAVSQPGDPEEEEADRVADAVVSRSPVPAIQSKCEACASGQPCDSCDDEKVRSKRRGGAAAPSAAGIRAAFGALRGGGERLPGQISNVFASRLDRDLSRVRIHTDSVSGAAARAIGARAYTVGSHVGFAPGEFRPNDREGQRLLAHELAHVAQNDSGGSGALISRECAPAPEEEVLDDTPDPAKPSYRYRGFLLTTDETFLAGQIRELFAKYGLATVDGLFRQMLWDEGVTPDGLDALTLVRMSDTQRRSAVEAEREARSLAPQIVPVVARVYAQVRKEVLAFIDNFQCHLRETLLTTLQESEDRIETERIRYGITATRDDGLLTYRAENTVAFQGLVGAAKDLLPLRRRLSALTRQRDALMPFHEFGMTPEVRNYVPEENALRHKELSDQVAVADNEYQQALQGAALRYPALMGVLDESGDDSPEARLERVASGDLVSEGPAFFPFGGLPGRRGGGAIGKVLDDRQAAIQTVREDVEDDSDKLWTLDSMVALTKIRLGTTNTALQNRWVNHKVKQVRSDEGWLQIALGVLAVGLALIAAIPSGGSSLVAAGTALAGLGSAALSGYQLVKSVKQYQLDMALTNTDLNRRAHAIAAEEPSFFWVALDLVGFIGDGAQALKGFRALTGTVRSALNAAPGAAAEAAARDLAAAADGLDGVTKPGLGKKLLTTLQALRAEESEAARALGKVGAEESQAVAKAAKALGAEADATEVAKIGAHEIKVTRSGALVRCSTECTWLREHFAQELAEDEDLLRRMLKAEDDVAKSKLPGGVPLDDAAKADVDQLAKDLEVAQIAREGREAGDTVVASAAGTAPKSGANWGIPEGGIPASERLNQPGVSVPAYVEKHPDLYYYQPGPEGKPGRYYRRTGFPERAAKGHEIPCFAAGTMVSTPAGPRAIETLASGDMVLTYEEWTGDTVVRPVIERHCSTTDWLYHVGTPGGTVAATGEHLFYVGAGDWRCARDLITDTPLRDTSGAVRQVRRVAVEESRLTATYNLAIAEHPHYFVGPDAVLVHNAGPYGIYLGIDPKTGKVIYVGQTLQDLAVRQGQHQLEGRVIDSETPWKKDMVLEWAKGPDGQPLTGLTEAEAHYHERLTWDAHGGEALKNRQIPYTDEKMAAAIEVHCPK